MSRKKKNPEENEKKKKNVGIKIEDELTPQEIEIQRLINLGKKYK